MYEKLAVIDSHYFRNPKRHLLRPLAAAVAAVVAAAAWVT